MTNDPLLNYKPGLTMDTPVTVTLAAADWAVFMAWFTHVNTDGVNHIVYGSMSKQIADAIYTQASLQAAKAHYADQPNPIQEAFQQMGMPFGQFPTPEDIGQETIFAGADEIWVIQCGICGSRDDYRPYHTGVQTCGHDGPRSVVEIRSRPKEGQL